MPSIHNTVRVLEMVEWRIGRVRHLVWNSCHDEAQNELFGMRHMRPKLLI